MAPVPSYNELVPAARAILAAAVPDLRRAGTGGVAGILITALAALVIGGTLLGLVALARLTTAWRGELRVVVTLQDDSGRPSGEDGVAGAARALPGAGDVRYVSSAEALDDLRRYLGPAAAGLDRLPANPVPARVEVTPAAGLDSAGLRVLVEALRRLPGVEDVQAAIGWVEPAERAARALRVCGLALGAAVGGVAVLAIASATRLARAGHGGSPEADVRGAHVVQAAVLGVAGAALGWALLLLGSELAAPWTGRFVRETLGLTPLPAPAWSLVAALLGGGAMAGVVGGLLGSRG